MNVSGVNNTYGLIQVPTFPEFIDYVVRETVGLESPKDWKVLIMFQWILYETKDIWGNTIQMNIVETNNIWGIIIAKYLWNIFRNKLQFVKSMIDKHLWNMSRIFKSNHFINAIMSLLFQGVITWKSYYAKCLPCDVKYDAIMKVSPWIKFN